MLLWALLVTAALLAVAPARAGAADIETADADSTSNPDSAADPAAGGSGSDTQRRAQLLRRFADRLRELYAVDPPPLPNVSVTSLPGAAHSPVHASSEIPDGDELLFELRLGGLLLAPTIAGTKQGDAILLPLAELSGALAFAIQVDPLRRRAEGWFVREDRRFSLDLANGVAVVGNSPQTFDPLDVQVRETDIYISHRLLNAWFGLGLVPQLADLVLDMNPAETLPVQARLEREQRLGTERPLLLARAVNPLRPEPYRLASVPIVDLSVSQSLAGGDGSTRSTTSYALAGTGDLAYSSATFFLAGTPLREPTGTAVDVGRLTLRRDEPQGITPLGISRIELGEVRVLDAPGVAAGFERGIAISNERIDTRQTFDQVDITGEGLPGWDVDLFQNGVLVGSQRVGADGRYRFAQRDLFVGQNEFRLVFYGPQGEIREEVRRAPRGQGFADGGETLYSFSVTQRDKPVFNRLFTGGADTGSLRIAGSLRHGLSSRLTLSGAFQSVQNDDARRLFLQAGAVGRVGGGLVAGTITSSDSGGIGASLTGLSQIAQQSVQIGYSGQRGLFDTQSIDTFSAALSGGGILEGASYSYGLSGSQSLGTAGPTTLVTARGGVSFPGLSLIGSLNVTSIRDQTGASGGLQAVTRVGGSLLRGATAFQITPELELSAVAATASIPVFADDNLTVDANWLPTADIGQFRLSYDFAFESFRLGPSLTADTTGAFSIGAVLGASAARDPIRGNLTIRAGVGQASGGVSVRVFEDLDRDGVFGPDDRPLEGIAVFASPGGHPRATTGPDGVALLLDMGTTQPLDIVVDESTLPDAFQRPAPGSAVSIQPRAGRIVALDQPVVMTDEVEGRLLAERQDGQALPAAGVRVSLVDPTGHTAATATTDMEGLYYLGALPRGRYLLNVDPLGVRRFRVEPPGPVPVEVTGQGEFVELDRIVLPRRYRGLVLAIGDYRTIFTRLADWVILRRQVPELALRTRVVDIAGEADGGPSPLLLGPIGNAALAAELCAQVRSTGRTCQVI